MMLAGRGGGDRAAGLRRAAQRRPVERGPPADRRRRLPARRHGHRARGTLGRRAGLPDAGGAARRQTGHAAVADRRRERRPLAAPRDVPRPAGGAARRRAGAGRTPSPPSSSTVAPTRCRSATRSRSSCPTTPSASSSPDRRHDTRLETWARRASCAAPISKWANADDMHAASCVRPRAGRHCDLIADCARTGRRSGCAARSRPSPCGRGAAYPRWRRSCSTAPTP